MEDVIEIISISDLLNLSLPVAGAVSLLPASTSPPPLKRSRPNIPGKMNTPLFAPDRNPNHGTFSSIGRPVLLVGTVDLFPWDSERSIGCFNQCVSFSDGSSKVCCNFLDFDPKAIGRKIHVLAWFFLPYKHSTGGVLEVIRWSFPDSEAAFDCDSALSISSTISPQAANSKANARASGILRAVSPIFCVPCVKGKDDRRKKSGASLVDSGDVIGFLAEIVTCVCSLCSGSRFVSEHCRSSGVINSHSFTNSVYIYFIMPTHVWRPVLYRQIGELITVSWLKKKMVFVGSEVSYSMFVSTAVTTVSFSQLPVIVTPVASPIRSDKEIYNGVVTGIYMKGMVIELDDKIWLLITDPVFASQHSVRVGTIVRRQISVRNFHLVCAKYSWRRILLIGTCLRTCISTKSFSTSEIRCCFKPENTSLLEKFIESLTFSAKFWVLLLVSCFKKKFAGIFSHKDILGSKKKEGLVQTYARRILLPNDFLVKSGLFMNFCKHGLCSHRSENLSFLKLVIPISNLTSWCEATWVSMLSQEHNANVVSGTDHYSDQFFPRGTMHDHMIRRIIMSDDIGFILMGTFKVSPYSVRLQLTDATGSIDVVMPDSPLNVDFQTVYEIRDYKLVMEGSTSKVVGDLQYRLDEPLSCRSIFQTSSKQNELELTPMSFIVVNTVKELCSQPNHRSVIQSSRRSVLHEHSMHSSPPSVVANIHQCVDSKLSRFHCRVVNVIWIVLENQTHESVELQSGRYRRIPAVNIPRALFLLDDGSSLCTCWANYGQAETLLRMHESTNRAFFRISELSRNKYSHNTVGHCLHKLLRKHNGVTIRNHGVESNLHSVHLTFSSNSNEVFSNQEKRVLQFIILNACHASTFITLNLSVVHLKENIAGDMMDSNGLFCDNMELLKYHQKLKPVPHLRVKEVLHVNPMKEARNILNDLYKG